MPEMIFAIGDTVVYEQPWRADELPNTPGRGGVLDVVKSTRGFTYLRVSGRERLLDADRVIKIERREAVAA
jgi:hypothetical protein